ncbi:MAG: hypothetical protein KGR19_05350 [Acidobacteria bacterium]|nr:hypothetical protein [Solirubrobacteraceae bacterium]MBU6337231.1 hypothetical protein [Acidobacteriota bacterium]
MSAPKPPTEGRKGPVPSLSFTTLKRLSFAHSGAYVILLAVWLIPGLALAESIFGFTHGIGWILMVLLVLVALQARVLGLRLAFAVAVLGAIAPFFGSWEFVREQRRRDARAAAAPDGSGGEPSGGPANDGENAVANSELAGSAR